MMFYQSSHFGSFPIFINSNMRKSLIGFVEARKKKLVEGKNGYLRFKSHMFLLLSALFC